MSTIFVIVVPPSVPQDKVVEFHQAVCRTDTAGTFVAGA
ncbi:hypothetical protein ABID21_004425 [Pseudorhizobium tarimense]|uniref:Antibiotic biosynthesis monooxygenase n=1 Tax=Pseudorhizobium tarimense TaxID=1079109 RepID=A0ABV2HCK8_9HYPH